MATENTLRLRDAALSGTIALPNAANTACTTVIDMEAATPFVASRTCIARITTTLATGANSLNINVVYQDSADNITFANIPELSVLTIAGNATKYPANTRNVILPPSTRRYLRAAATGEANGGNSSDGTLTIDLLF